MEGVTRALRELARLTGWTGRQVLYVGDHLMADLAEPRRQAGWATAAIVRELEEELLIQTTEQYKDYHTRALAVSSMLRRLQSLDLPEEERDAALDALEALSVLLGGGWGASCNLVCLHLGGAPQNTLLRARAV